MSYKERSVKQWSVDQAKGVSQTYTHAACTSGYMCCLTPGVLEYVAPTHTCLKDEPNQ